MTPDDILDCLAVRTATIENVVTQNELIEWGVSVESITEALCQHVRGWVFETDDRVVGFCMADSKSAEILVIAVHPRFEKKAIGSTLLLQAQSWLFSLGHKEISLKTAPNPNFRAYGFYQHYGWRPTGQLVDGDEVFVLSTGS